MPIDSIWNVYSSCFSCIISNCSISLFIYCIRISSILYRICIGCIIFCICIYRYVSLCQCICFRHCLFFFWPSRFCHYILFGRLRCFCCRFLFIRFSRFCHYILFSFSCFCPRFFLYIHCIYPVIHRYYAIPHNSVPHSSQTLV